MSNQIADSPKPEAVSTEARLRGTPAAIWRWLIEPSAAILEPERRYQARLLMTMLIVLIALGLVSMIMSLFGVFSRPGEPESVGKLFRLITMIVVSLLAGEYLLSRSVHYQLAAAMAVFSVVGATFVMAVLNPKDLQFLYFLILGGLIGSLFLSARATMLIFMVTLVGLLALPFYVPGLLASSTVNALFLIVTVGGLVVMAASLRERYLKQLDWQTHKLLENEARLRELSIRDPLTGLFNRRYLEEALALEILRAERKRIPIGIIMADIDHFKPFNDNHGHAAGDAVLVQVGNFLRTHVRASDIVCRYGGEEFLLILPEATPKITLTRAESMRADAGRLHVRHEGQVLESVTLSLGVAMYPEHGFTGDTLLAAADAAMYRAKREGRDRVVIANQ
jgi:diguanylate cyclase (GGDEF)-like protein